MKVLLVEDEEHKATDLRNRLYHNGVKQGDLTVVTGVREAVLLVENQDFGLLILDMALPTFSTQSLGQVRGGTDQALGGVEVLRALNAENKTWPIIVVTQYPEVVIGGETIRLSEIAKAIMSRYRQKVVGSILYSYNTPAWKIQFDKAVGRAG